MSVLASGRRHHRARSTSEAALYSRQIEAAPAPAKPLFEYRLCVLTDGRPCLRETLESFHLRVTPRPTEIVMFDDGGTQRAHEKVTSLEPLGVPFYRFVSASRVGFCHATAALWRMAATPGPDWIFWLEDDFHFTERIDLTKQADVMNAEPQLAQMALYRNPYSSEEKLAGGYLNLAGRSYERRETAGHRWFEHNAYWTTNPSLFRRRLAVENPWPGSIDQCEGRFGVQLKAGRSSTTFGVWGDGTTAVRHVGVRSGHGY